MKRALLLAAIAYSSASIADCGNITKQLFGVDVGGPRLYRERLPQGLSLFPQRVETLNSGIDGIVGKSRMVDIKQAQVYWHQERVTMVMAHVQFATPEERDAALNSYAALSGKEPVRNERTGSIGFKCGDGLTVTLGKSQQVWSKEKTVPMVMVLVEHPQLKADMFSQASQSKETTNQELLAAAEKGDARAQMILGKQLLGKGDREGGRKWLRRSAEAGNVDAQFDLGKSLGIFEDPESWTWFEKAALQGDMETLSYVYMVTQTRMCEQAGARAQELLQRVSRASNLDEKFRSAAQARSQAYTRSRANCNRER